MAAAESYPHYIEFRHVYKTFDKPVKDIDSVDMTQWTDPTGLEWTGDTERAASRGLTIGSAQFGTRPARRHERVSHRWSPHR